MSHEEEARLAEQDEDADFRARYLRAMRAYFALAASPTGSASERAWALHDHAEGLAMLCAGAFLTTDYTRRDTPDWAAAHREWLVRASAHAGLADALTARPDR